MGNDSRSRVIPANQYRRVRWRNQMGWTREIHAGQLPAAGLASNAAGTAATAGGDDWDWRLSIAEIERDSAFSSFPGIERELVLLCGNGLRLRFDDGAVHELAPPHGKLRFAGESAVQGELVDGPTHDFNLMWRRDRVDAELWHRPLVGPMVIFVEPHTSWAVYVIAGQARFADDSGLPPLWQGDTALLEAGGTRQRHVLEGGGELLLVRVAALAQGATAG